jgi:hypothetical protein
VYGRPKSHPVKLALAARLRRKTTLTVEQLAERLGLGSCKSAAAKLQAWRKEMNERKYPKLWSDPFDASDGETVTGGMKGTIFATGLPNSVKITSFP